MGVAFTFAHAGLLLGTAVCVLCTVASAGAACLLVDVVRACPPGTGTLSDVGKFSLGPTGAKCGLILQLSNFVLFLPVALLTTAEALQGAMQPSGETCANYYVFAVALACFATTQVRDFSNSTPLAAAALVAALAVAILQVVVVSSHPTALAADDEALLAGNPQLQTSAGSIRMALALTTCVWAYLPSILTAELSACMPRPAELKKAILLSAALNIATFVGTGLPVASLWGASITDPISIAPMWPKADPLARVLSAVLCVGNLVSYCLDSVPLGRWTQRTFFPRFADSWTVADCARYAAITFPTFAFAVAAAVLVGQPGGLFTMLAWVTALTVPALNLLYPAACALLAPPAPTDSAHLVSATRLDGQAAVGRRLLGGNERSLAWFAVVVGAFAQGISLFGALGRTVDGDVRGPEVIGCAGWGVYRSPGMSFAPFAGFT